MMDLAVAVVLLTLLSPLLLLVALAVRGKLGRPILFRQERAGLGGRPFKLAKFRSMLAQSDVASAPVPDEDRLTALGRFLRRTSIDELPELWHVVRGEMSLVGPRPLLLRYNDRYSERQARRLAVRPGLTGWAQINGRNDSTWQERLDRDVWYVDNMSFGLDLGILIRTVPAVLRGSGVSPQGRAFMPEFKGESTEATSRNPVRS